MNIFHILTIIFVIAKLMNVITWSWWLVLLPSSIIFGIGLITLILIGIIALIKD